MMNKPLFDDIGNYLGFAIRECGEHRTVGEHRAWCHDCAEWCYPGTPCVRCEISTLRRTASAPNVRTNDHATSVEGAVAVAGRAPNQRMRLLRMFGVYEWFDGITDEEAAEAAELLGSCYWKRCGELRADGLIEFTGATRMGSGGVNRKVSRITERGRSVLRAGSANE